MEINQNRVAIKNPFDGMNLVNADSNLLLPKYMQIVEIIKSDIDNKIWQYGEMIPSVQETCLEFDMGKNTVERAYTILKELGVITSIKGKGYYVASPVHASQTKVLILINAYENDKKVLIDNLKKHINEGLEYEIYMYQDRGDLLEKCLLRNLNKYDFYVVVPDVKDITEELRKVLNLIPNESLIMYGHLGIADVKNCSAVYQNFHEVAYGALTVLENRARHYNKIKLVINDRYCNRELIEGFADFCLDHQITFEFSTSADDIEVAKGDAFIVISDDDLINVIKRVDFAKQIIGEDVGILCFYDSPLREILRNGISAIAPDAINMVKELATILNNRMPRRAKGTYKIIDRKSF